MKTHEGQIRDRNAQLRAFMKEKRNARLKALQGKTYFADYDTNKYVAYPVGYVTGPIRDTIPGQWYMSVRGRMGWQQRGRFRNTSDAYEWANLTSKRLIEENAEKTKA